MNDNDQIYHYDEVFGSVAKNREVFDRTMLTPIHNALNGLNSTVFIYGMTGAGKTYTMFNNFGNGRENDQGIVGLTIDHLFEEIKREQMQAQILISFFEIYNENIRDLLSEAGQNLSIM